MLVISLLIFIALPLYTVLSGQAPLGRDFRTADRSSAGIAPRAENTPEAIVQVYHARALNWRGIFGAPAITAAQTAALIKIVQGATESASWKETLTKLGWSPIFLSGDDYKKFVDEDSKRIAGIIDSLGIKGKK